MVNKNSTSFRSGLASFISKSSLILFFCATLLTLLCHFVPWSERWAIVEYLVLFTPRWLIFIILMPVVLIEFSLIKKYKVLLSCTVLYLLIFYINIELPLKKVFTANEKGDLRVMTSNLGGIGKQENNYKLLAQIKYSRAEVIAFQEATAIDVRKNVPANWNVECMLASCIASIYKITSVDSNNRRFLGGWGNIGALFKVDVKGESVFVLNVHLETPRKGIENFQLSKLNLDPLYNNARNRYIEANIVKDWVNKKSPLIILGDFNMPIESGIYRDFFSDYNNAFNEAGVGVGYTKYTKLIGVRIDHILVDDSFDVINAWVGENVGSDHRAVFADLKFKVLH